MPKEWSADEILGVSGGYQSACVLAAAADLDLFTVLADGPLDAQEVTDRLGADLRGIAILLDALAALELLEKRDGQYAVPRSVAPFLTQGSPVSVLPMVQHRANCLRRWVQLAGVVQTGRPGERQPSVRGEAADETAFIGAMHNVSDPVAARVIDEIGPLEFTHLLDIGGASGTWTIAFLRNRPRATATLFDLPHVIPLAEERIRETGMQDRIRLVAGDFSVDPMPKGADLAWVSAIAHQNSRDENRRLFSSIFETLNDGGHILVRDVLMEESRTSPAAGAMFAVNMLVATEGGSTLTFEELREDIEAAGFVDTVVLRRDEWMDSVVGAKKPAGASP